MRKHVKQEILQLIESLYQAHREIEDIIKRNQVDVGRSMLGECQEYAISLGNIIEQMEGEGCVTISYLEKYCEVLFRVHESLQMNANMSKAMKKLDNALVNIENSIKYDITLHKEVVFLPYKASMWDSLESVYLAAKEDPNCDAYCVPIPYFDRNADGSLGQMHYEGNEYPQNVEVIDWRKYNLTDRRPDTIYIHNPYDECNRVTCVHPDYFSSKLKKHTDELIYIPYFVLQEIDPNNQMIIDGMKHFCFQPAIINADKVILQSENMKQIYVAEYLKAAKARGLSGVHTDKEALDKKFLGIGSPKFDKVLRTKREDLKVPQEWLKIIKKSDGNWKKIIFYNTSIGALLEHNEMMLEKMERVFETFKEQQEDVVLLWRPHPLIASTIKSMRPQLWIKYQELLGKYVAEGWGIYDDTADVNRAIALSDAYYGDASSIVELYKKCNKKVLIQNVHVNTSLSDEPLVFEDLFVDDSCFWFVCWNYNALYKVNNSMNKAEFVLSFEDEEMDEERLFSKIINSGNTLFFIPLRSKALYSYNKETGEMRRYIIEEEYLGKIDGYSGWNFYSAHLYRNRIYMLPYQRKNLLIFNIETETFEYIDMQYDAYMQNKCNYGGRFIFQSVLVEDKIYAPLAGNSSVVCFDIKEKTIKYYLIESENKGYADILFDGENMLLVPLIGYEIIKWNQNQNLVIKKVVIEEKGNINITFWGGEMHNGYAYLFPNEYDKVLRWNLEDDSIDIMKDTEELCIEESNIIADCQFTMCKVINETLYTHTGRGNELCKLDEISGKWEKKKIYMDECAKEEFRKKLCKIYKKNSNQVMFENLIYSVNYLL